MVLLLILMPALARQHVGPPLQPDFAGQGLADLVANPANFDIEGIEREQPATLICRVNRVDA